MKQFYFKATLTTFLSPSYVFVAFFYYLPYHFFSLLAALEQYFCHFYVLFHVLFLYQFHGSRCSQR